MHPILARGGRVALYLGVWICVGLLLAGLLAMEVGIGRATALAIALPLATACAFVCLSAWYSHATSSVNTCARIRTWRSWLNAATASKP